MVTVREDDADIEVKELELSKVEEDAIIALTFDAPEYFSSILPYLKAEYFNQIETKFVFNVIEMNFKEHNSLLSRKMCKSIVDETLTADDPHDRIHAIILTESDPRDVPVVIEKLTEWVKKKAYAKLYSKESLEAHERGDYEVVEKILDDARKISNFNVKCFSFFDDFHSLFVEEQIEHFTTGFPTLDKHINFGGPTRGEVFCFMAPTGVGKSIALVNIGAANIRQNRNVLHVSLEMSDAQIATRYLGCFTELWTRKRFEDLTKEKMIKRINKIKNTYGSHLEIVGLPPDECSTDSIASIMDNLRRTKGIKFDVVLIDYLELLMSRRESNNDDEYRRQKHVATECTRLGVKENVWIATATQTNRSGDQSTSGDFKNPKQQEEKMIDLNKTAESYGKNMPLSYVVSINQTRQQYGSKKEEIQGDTTSLLDLYIAKNRNGPKFIKISTTIDYEIMKMMEQM